jgi:hypothetical protein
VIDGAACLDVPVEDDFGAASDELKIAAAVPASFAAARLRAGAAPVASR